MLYRKHGPHWCHPCVIILLYRSCTVFCHLENYCNETISGVSKTKYFEGISKPIFIKLVSMESQERGPQYIISNNNIEIIFKFKKNCLFINCSL